MHPLRRTLSGAAAALAVSLVGTSVVLAAPAAQAADPRVCATGKAPTAKTQPWFDFAETPNPIWAAQVDFKRFVTRLTAALAQLGPASSEAEVDRVLNIWDDHLEVAGAKITYPIQGMPIAMYELFAELSVVDPAAAAVVVQKMDQIFDGGPIDAAMDQLTDYLNTVGALLGSTTAPLPGPVVLPSATPALNAVTTIGKALDQFSDFARSKVVYSGTRTTCTTTASLSVGATGTTFGKARTVTFRATKGGAAVRGDYVVLLDGRSVNSGRQLSTFTATIPATTRVGSRVLTVAFVPVDGSPVSVRSVQVKVAKARTRTTLKLSKKKSPRAKSVKATVRVAVPGASVKAQGVATLKVGTRTLKVKVRKGVGRVTIGKAPVGKNRLKAVFTGTGSFKPSTSKPVTLQIT